MPRFFVDQMNIYLILKRLHSIMGVLITKKLGD